MKAFALKISTPEGDVFSGEVLSVSVRGAEGDLAVMAGHIPFITTTKAGEIKVKTENGEEVYEASNGMLTVTKDVTTLLCGAFNKAENK